MAKGGYVLVWGQRVPTKQAVFDYVCGHCGAQLKEYTWGTLRCKGPEQHLITDHTGLANRQEYKPLSTDFEAQQARLKIGNATLPISTVANSYKCARCGAPLEVDEGEDALYCVGLPSHKIESGDDVKPIINYVLQQEYDADAFIEHYEGWNAFLGKEVDMRLKDRRTISTGMKRAGKIRQGYKVQVTDQQGQPRRYTRGPLKGEIVYRPVNVDYFVLHDAPKVAKAYERHPSVLRDTYGSGPAQLLVYLPFDDPERCFTARYEWRKGRVLYCAGDGDSVQYALSADGLHTVVRDGFAVTDYRDQEWSMEKNSQMPCSGSHLRGDGRWKRCAECTGADGTAAMSLRVLVRDPANPFTTIESEMGYYEIDTKSTVTYDNLVEQIDQLVGWAAKAGRSIVGIPLVLSRVPTTISYVKKDRNHNPIERATATHALMNLEPDPEWVKLMVELARDQAMLAAPVNGTPLALGAGNGNGNGHKDAEVLGGTEEDDYLLGHDPAEDEGADIVEGDYTASDAMPPVDDEASTGADADDRAGYWRSRGSLTLMIKRQSDMTPQDIWARAIELEAAGEIDPAWPDEKIADVILGVVPA